MVANKLTIEAELNADGVTKGIDDINNKLKTVGDSATKTGDSGAKAADRWAEALKGVGDAAPTSAQSAGMDKLATTTDKAAASASTAQTAFGRFAASFKGMAANIGSALKNAFSGLGSLVAGAGRVAGQAFMMAFRVGIVAVGVGAVLVGALALGLKQAYDLAKQGGERWMKTFTDAFSVGLDPLALIEFRAALVNIKDEAQNLGLAKAFGELQKTIRAGGKEAEQITTIISKLGGDPAEMVKGGQALIEQLGKVEGAYNRLDSQQRRGILEQLLPGANDKELAAFDLMMRTIGDNLDETSRKAAGFATQLAGALQQDAAMGQAAQAVKDALSNVFAAFNESFGVMDIYRNALGLIPPALQLVANALNSFADVVRKVPEAFKEFTTYLSGLATALAQFGGGVFQKAVKMFEALGSAFTLLGGIAWNAITAGINAIGDAVGKVVGWVQPAIDALNNLMSVFNKWKNLGSSGGPSEGGTTGGIGGWSIPFQSMPIAGQQPAFQALGAGQQTARAFGVLAAPMASGATVNGLSSGQWDRLIFNFREYEKAADRAASSAKGLKAANDNLTESTTGLNAAMSPLLSSLGLTAAELQRWVDDNVLAKSATDEWTDAQLRLKAALQGGLISVEQYGVAFERLRDQLDTSPMTLAINDLRQGFESFGDSAASSLADAIVNGEDLSAVLKNLAKQLASMMLQALVLKPLMNSIFGGMGGLSGFSAPMGLAGGVPALANPAGLLRAGGGPDLSGLSNFVGRQSAAAGSGTTTQNITQNVRTSIRVDTATGQTQVTASQGAAFARQVDLAVQQVLVREQRPGGVLYEQQRRGAA